MKDYIDLLGRLLLGFLFSHEAYDMIAYLVDTKERMSRYGLTWRQEELVYVAVAILVLGSVLLIIGYRSKLAATLLLSYWVPITFIVYPFWNAPPPEGRELALRFMENMAVAGGLLMILAHGTGGFAVRKIFARARVAGQ